MEQSLFSINLEYMQTIKDLKKTLQDKTDKQKSLKQELQGLTKEYSNHQ
jgi:ribosome recycling factor